MIGLIVVFTLIFILSSISPLLLTDDTQDIVKLEKS